MWPLPWAAALRGAGRPLRWKPASSGPRLRRGEPRPRPGSLARGPASLRSPGVSAAPSPWPPRSSERLPSGEWSTFRVSCCSRVAGLVLGYHGRICPPGAHGARAGGGGEAGEGCAASDLGRGRRRARGEEGRWGPGRGRGPLSTRRRGEGGGGRRGPPKRGRPLPLARISPLPRRRAHRSPPRRRGPVWTSTPLGRDLRRPYWPQAGEDVLLDGSWTRAARGRPHSRGSWKGHTPDSLGVGAPQKRLSESLRNRTSSGPGPRSRVSRGGARPPGS